MKIARRSVFTMVIFALLLAACAPSAPAAPQPTAPEPAGSLAGSLASSRWQLESFTQSGAATRPAGKITLDFDSSGRVSGSAGCNSYGGSYEIKGDAITLGQMVSTLMACADETVMRQESAYLAMLSKVTRAAVDGQRLTLTGEGVSLTFVSTGSQEATPVSLTTQSLTGSRWQLESILQGGAASSVLSGTQLTLAFNENGQISGSGGCNRYSSSYTLADGAIQVAPVASTRMACEGSLAQEQQFFKLLESAARAEMQGDRLVLSSTDGQSSLVFAPVDAP